VRARRHQRACIAAVHYHVLCMHGGRPVRLQG
jgi:hypothetical protein